MEGHEPNSGKRIPGNGVQETDSGKADFQKPHSGKRIPENGLRKRNSGKWIALIQLLGIRLSGIRLSWNLAFPLSKFSFLAVDPSVRREHTDSGEGSQPSKVLVQTSAGRATIRGRANITRMERNQSSRASLQTSVDQDNMTSRERSQSSKAPLQTSTRRANNTSKDRTQSSRSVLQTGKGRGRGRYFINSK